MQQAQHEAGDGLVAPRVEVPLVRYARRGRHVEEVRLDALIPAEAEGQQRLGRLESKSTSSRAPRALRKSRYSRSAVNVGKSPGACSGDAEGDAGSGDSSFVGSSGSVSVSVRPVSVPVRPAPAGPTLNCNEYRSANGTPAT